MADNTKYMARVPIVPDDFAHKDNHKDHELVMNFNNNDIYVKKGDGYVNITGEIKESIKEIQDGSVVVHICTEDTLPPVKDRKENHWYYVILRSETMGGDGVSAAHYIYYGLVDEYNPDKNYILVGQNMIIDDDVVNIKVLEGYKVCFYIPISMSASFAYDDTKENIPYTVEDRVYAVNNESGQYVAYDVYILNIDKTGEMLIDVNLDGTDYVTVSFDKNTEVAGLVLPDELRVKIGSSIGKIADPDWSDPRYEFKGYSLDSAIEDFVTSSYKPETDTTLYAWFTYNEDPSLLTYKANYTSES